MSPRADWIEHTIPKLYPELKSLDVYSILDIGGGLSNKTDYIILDSGEFPGRFTVVVLDIFKPYLEEARRTSKYKVATYINADAIDIEKLFLPKSFDLCILNDVIEHNPKAKSLQIIAMAEKLAKKAVVIECPKGYVPQDLDVTGWNNPHQAHHCGWEREELEQLGYTVREREYTMMDVVRNSSGEKYSPNIILMNAIKLL